MYATCRSCNSFGGRAYVPAYTDFVASTLDALVNWGSAYIHASPPPRLRMSAVIQPGAVIRQVLHMLLTASGGPGLGERYPTLRSIVLEQSTSPLPSNIRIYLSLVITSRIRINSVQARMNLNSGAVVAMAEVAGPPFAWLLEIDGDGSNQSQDVSNWTTLDPGRTEAVDINTTLGSIVNPFAGDYRHRWQVEEDSRRERLQ